mgnify:CR=1 FL=1
MRDILVFLGALVVALAWIPIMLKFFRAWRQRSNPVSLAICGLIVFVVYSNVVMIATYLTQGNMAAAFASAWGFNTLSCINFYFAFRWADKHFNTARQ